MLRTGIVAVATAALVAPALADYQKPMNLSFRAGGFFAQGVPKNVEGTNWFTAGLELKLRDLSTGGASNAHYSVSLDYYGKGSYSNIPLLLNYVSRGDHFYWSAGAGVSFAHTPGVGGSDSEMEFAYQLSVGKDFVRNATPLFVEFRYFGSNVSDLSGFSLVGGIRF